jgi:hypothetical protein
VTLLCANTILGRIKEIGELNSYWAALGRVSFCVVFQKKKKNLETTQRKVLSKLHDGHCQARQEDKHVEMLLCCRCIDPFWELLKNRNFEVVAFPFEVIVVLLEIIYHVAR